MTWIVRKPYLTSFASYPRLSKCRYNNNIDLKFKFKKCANYILAHYDLTKMDAQKRQAHSPQQNEIASKLAIM